MRFFSISDIEQIDLGKLAKAVGAQAWNPFSTQGQYISAILRSYDTFQKYDINSALRLSHFLGQGLVETGFLKAKGENLNYSAERLLKIFPKYFSNLDEAKQFERNPEKIANRVYADRMGNGPEASGDGWRYRGRGFFQLTGKDNYKKFGDMAGIDLVGDPDVLTRDLKTSVEVAAAFFQKAGLNAFADKNDVAAVSRGVNRGNPLSKAPAHGEAERIVWTKKAVDLTRNPNGLLLNAPPGGQASAGAGVLSIGSTGDAVAEVQRFLAALGYAVGAADGVYGPSTSRAVLNFQHEHGLAETGNVDAATKAALQAALDGKEVAPPPQPVPVPAPDQPAPNQPAPEQPAPEQPSAEQQPPAAAPVPPVAQAPAPAPRPPLPAPERKTAPPPAPADRPLSRSRTIWGAILAGLAGMAAFVRQIADMFPIVDTPIGKFNTIWILAAFFVMCLAFVIFARVDDRSKTGR